MNPQGTLAAGLPVALNGKLNGVHAKRSSASKRSGSGATWPTGNAVTAVAGVSRKSYFSKNRASRSQNARRSIRACTYSTALYSMPRRTMWTSPGSISLSHSPKCWTRPPATEPW